MFVFAGWKKLHFSQERFQVPTPLACSGWGCPYNICQCCCKYSWITVHSVYTVCTHCLHSKYTLCTHSVPGCVYTVYIVYTLCEHAVHTMCTECRQCVPTGVNNPISHTKVRIVCWGLLPKHFTPCFVVYTVQCSAVRTLQCIVRVQCNVHSFYLMH